ncbi:MULTISPECIES: 1-deoxy-D-xylulose-5-phosphate synthase [unclassified Rothia (in: high G+C Gram-positive bacteria)]|uniref:1-deoxy-D-xylulose-5-phosphate synthase n=1 Tax=unclassified Rothia (in: high G+C Gram-positive bacteria) TaxID=2689056 RepID=UPI00195BA907|nr:1-deoxy-D-xylulose-5-phosphate synthase [Rothia sp. ZJ932]MBM7050689.1 1-deoxy-D-xylulose-5-phosphate synthase [Rothia sp. ZJ1223]QRZ60875.1 1-deoxy-D-xylulose-5-phosphate synthase [Rothia sp. ZJ932]
MGLLDSIKQPSDLNSLSTDQLKQLAHEIRDFLVNNVAKTGGHLGPNLGVVELTVGMHRVFSSPHDSFIFDTGHQSYVHKLLTGRQDFETLRQKGGLSGYPERAESEHDIVESSHASSSLSWADGISRAHAMNGESERYTVVLVGDGALTGGMTWEAINNIAADKNRRVVIIVNDNGRSYAPTIGGFANHLTALKAEVQSKVDQVRLDRRYDKALDAIRRGLQSGGRPGQALYRGLHGMKAGIKDVMVPGGLFEDLGMKYVGPIDGHDQEAVIDALQAAKNFAGPVIVHAMTEKGHGYAPAVAHADDMFHAVGVIDPATGKGIKSSSAASWTSVFAEEIKTIADERADIVGITGAMLIPVGLHKMAAAHPERVIDVGIAEQHAIAMSAGLAYGGQHPVVALYATFLNRGFDQLLMDVALHKAGVTIVLDRSGVTGPDGASHHGMWDLSLLQFIPGLHLAAPRDAATLREELREAVAIDNAPTVVRYPKGSVGDEIPSIKRYSDGVDVLYSGGTAHTETDQKDVLLVAVGAFARLALDVASRLEEHEVSVTVIDPRWVMPVPASVIEEAAKHRIVVSLEDGVRAGGVGSRIRQEMRAAGVDTALNELGLPADFIKHASREEILDEVGLNPEQITSDLLAQLSGQKVPFARGKDEKPKHTNTSAIDIIE